MNRTEYYINHLIMKEWNCTIITNITNIAVIIINMIVQFCFDYSLPLKLELFRGESIGGGGGGGGFTLEKILLSWTITSCMLFLSNIKCLINCSVIVCK